MTSDRRARPSRRGPSVLAVLALAVALTVGGAPPLAAKAPDTADRPRTGYPVAPDGTAGGVWLGSRTAGRQVVYRIDPRRHPRTPAFGPARWVATLEGSGPVTVTRWRVRRAAWLLSKYGGYDSAAQSAAVELALDHLLHGGAHRLGGERSRRRLQQSGAQDAIVPLATYLLEASRRLAGPYQVSLSATGTPVGGTARFAVTVTAARTGEPVPHLPVTVTYDGRRMTGTTDDNGVVAAAATALRPGPRPVVVRVEKLPSDRLLLRRPTRGTASRVVVAGRKTRTMRSHQVAIQARPTVSVAVTRSGATSRPVPGTLWVAAGYPSIRTARLTLHGPFPDAAAAECSPEPASATSSQAVHENGGYAVPPVRVAAPGFYRWSVAVEGDSYNLPAAACSEPFAVRATPRLTVTALDARISSGGSTRARLRVTDLPPDYADQVAVRLFGPFDTRARARCDAGTLVRRRSVAVTAPATDARSDALRLTRRGVYAWQAVLPGATLSARVVTDCGLPGAFVRVR